MSEEYTRLHFRKRKTLTVESKVCTGCRTCEVICSLSHEGQVDLERSRLYVKANPFSGFFFPQVCHHCSDAPCFYACQESAIGIDAVNGTVILYPGKCTGCQSCMEVCPFKVIRFDEERRKAFKCDFCKGSPECVKWCPVNALGVVEFCGEVPR